MDEGVFDARGFLGRGWSFPVRLDPSGGMATVAHRAAIERSIRLILETSPGERPMRPTFGAGLRRMVYEPIDTTTLAQIRKRIEEALVEWEPRIEVERVAVTSAEKGRSGRLMIEIGYRIIATNNSYNMVYPFYLAEGRP